jgi:hypothetical protein
MRVAVEEQTLEENPLPENRPGGFAQGRQGAAPKKLGSVGFARLAELFHHRLDEFFGVGEFLGDHAEVHGGDGGVALAGAVDAVLADQDKGIGDAVEGDGEASPVAPKALLGVLEFVVMLLECRHEGCLSYWTQLAKFPQISGRCTSGTGPRRESLPYRSAGR